MQITGHPILASKIRSVSEIGITENRHGNDTVLLEEITHRINNDLTSTIALIELTAARSPNEDVRFALAGVAQHVQEMARVQNALRMPREDQSIDATSYLRALCHAISLARLQYRNIELVLREVPLTLGARHCWKLAMIVSELIANSARHAFEGRGGKIFVELSRDHDAVRCSVIDNGSAAVSATPGHGSKIVRTLTDELHGRIDYMFGAQGTIVTLSFPAGSSETGTTPGS
ncbi:MAG: sensor histidine kinase [Bradyrhizobium sp.]